MPYVVPTAFQLKDKFPVFEAVADTRVSMALDEAFAEVPVTWPLFDYEAGILYLAAHLLVVDGVPTSAGTSTGLSAATLEERAAAVSEVNVGDVRVKFGGSTSAATSAARTGYNSTAYGRRYAEIRLRNTGYSYPLQRV